MKRPKEWMTVNMLMGCFQPGLRGVSWDDDDFFLKTPGPGGQPKNRGGCKTPPNHPFVHRVGKMK